jgi:hypothetical protein
MTEREQRLDDLDALLLKAATELLGADEQDYLDRLREEFPEVDTEAYERTAALVLLAALSPLQPLPETIKARLFASSADLFEKAR